MGFVNDLYPPSGQEVTVTLDDPSMRVEFGHYFRIVSIDRTRGVLKLRPAEITWSNTRWFDRVLRGLKPRRVILVDQYD